VSWWDLPALPKLNVATLAVREYLMDVACHWIDFGVDGWRLDVPAEIDDDAFWQEFRLRVKAINPDAYIVGEIWGDGRRWLQGDQFDAVTNYLFARSCLGFFVGDRLLKAEVRRTGYHEIATLDAKGFSAAIDRILGLYPPEVTEVQFNLLGSHDTPRHGGQARSGLPGRIPLGPDGLGPGNPRSCSTVHRPPPSAPCAAHGRLFLVASRGQCCGLRATKRSRDVDHRAQQWVRDCDSKRAP
jgi:glycosidase